MAPGSSLALVDTSQVGLNAISTASTNFQAGPFAKSSTGGGVALPVASFSVPTAPSGGTLIIQINYEDVVGATNGIQTAGASVTVGGSSTAASQNPTTMGGSAGNTEKGFIEFTAPYTANATITVTLFWEPSAFTGPTQSCTFTNVNFLVTLLKR